MSQHSNQVQKYLAAHAREDATAVSRVLEGIPDTQLEAFLLELESAGHAEPIALSRTALESSLERAGVGANDAVLLSVLSTGSFTDFVRTRFAAQRLNADSVLQAIDDLDAALTGEQQEDLERWLDAVLHGDEPSEPLPTASIAALARACGASTDTLVSLLERTPQEDQH